MSLDIIRKAVRTMIRSKTGSGATNVNGGVITIPLSKNFLTDEYRVNVMISQSFAVAPSSSDVRRFFKSIQLVVDKGEGIKLNGHAAYDLARLTEKAHTPTVVLGTPSTCEFSFELHGKNDGAIGGLATSWLTGKYGTLDLVLEINPDATNGFIGGTTPGVATYDIEVYPSEYRTMTPFVRDDVEGSGWGISEHCGVMLSNIRGDVSGYAQEHAVKGGNKTRFIIMHAFDAASGGNLTDAVFRNGARVSMTVGDLVIYANTKLSELQKQLEAERDIALTGVCVLDAGDDPNGWWDLRNVKEQKLDINIPASANLPAAWRLEIAQDYSRDLESLHEALRS